MNAQPDTSSHNEQGLPKFIQSVEAGSSDTLLSASRGNDLVRTANAIQALRGVGQIKVLFTDANMSISFIGEIDKDSIPKGGALNP